MSALLILIPLSLATLAIGIAVFFWAVRDGQYDDLESAAWRVVLDDDGTAGDESRDA